MRRGEGPPNFKAADLPKIELTNADLPRIVNGRPGDPIELRPFSYAFSRKKVHGANAKVGAVPLTRAALLNPKVRKELLVQDTPQGAVAEINSAHKQNLAQARALALNTDVMEMELPRRFDVVAPPTDEEEIIRKLKETGCTQAST